MLLNPKGLHIAMNNQDLNFVSSLYSIAPIRRNSPAVLSRAEAVQEVASPTLSEDELVIWSNSYEGAAGVPSEAPANRSTSGETVHRDLGLWLLFSVFLRRDPWSRLSASPLADFSTAQPAPTLWYSAIKRACDIAAALVLSLLLLPIFVAIGLLIKLDSPGPVFFRQRRVGKNGREFQLWKFRSMKIEAQMYDVSPKADSDWRITRVGRLIRRVSIDELPQLLNVLRGEMSLVGPRPEMPFIANRYKKQERRRLTVKPGITGLWQVGPARGFPIHQNLQYDLHYIQHQNFVLDAAIILYTLVAVFRGVGAV
jgi:lipopolysaccharide/colanic/teichoic acid biosynthesis glycosyltransferase